MSKKTQAPAKLISPPVRRKRQSADLMSSIIESAAEEFRRVGYDGATTAAIARKADVSEAQLFRNFGSKANLFREAIFKPLDEQLAKFTSEHLSDGVSPSVFKENSALYIDQLRSFLSANVDEITSLIAVQIYESEATEGVGAIESLGRYFERGAATMAGRAHQDEFKVKPELMVRVSFAAVLACVMFRSWIFPPGLASDEEINKAIDTFVLEGLSANRRPA
jgi:AcrR family transcriptional regulator